MSRDCPSTLTDTSSRTSICVLSNGCLGASLRVAVVASHESLEGLYLCDLSPRNAGIQVFHHVYREDVKIKIDKKRIFITRLVTFCQKINDLITVPLILCRTAPLGRIISDCKLLIRFFNPQATLACPHSVVTSSIEHGSECLIQVLADNVMQRLADVISLFTACLLRTDWQMPYRSTTSPYADWVCRQRQKMNPYGTPHRIPFPHEPDSQYTVRLALRWVIEFEVKWRLIINNDEKNIRRFSE